MEQVQFSVYQIWVDLTEIDLFLHEFTIQRSSQFKWLNLSRSHWNRLVFAWVDNHWMILPIFGLISVILGQKQVKCHFPVTLVKTLFAVFRTSWRGKSSMPVANQLQSAVSITTEVFAYYYLGIQFWKSISVYYPWLWLCWMILLDSGLTTGWYDSKFQLV